MLENINIKNVGDFKRHKADHIYKTQLIKKKKKHYVNMTYIRQTLILNSIILKLQFG